MIRILERRWRARLAASWPWARWTAVALGSTAILTLAPPHTWIRASVAPALAIAVTQLGLLARAAHRRPQLDRGADDHFQVLVDRTCLPHVQLVEVHAVQRVSAAGQLAHTIDLADGHFATLWFTQACFPSGTLVLIDLQGNSLRALDWMLPDEVQAAYRHHGRTGRDRVRAEAALQRELAEDLNTAPREDRGKHTQRRAPQARAA